MKRTIIILTIALGLNLIPLDQTKIHDDVNIERHEYKSKIEPNFKALSPISRISTVHAETAPQSSQNGSNEKITWDFFISKGFTKEQTAGILGNLAQENRFRTSDELGGLGIAQWIGGRRANLVARGNYTDINVQLQFLLDELNGVEHRANNMVKNSSTVEGATIAFQNGFERCGDCRQGTRIQYAHQFYAKYK